MGIIVWIIFGGLAGWIGSMIMNTDSQQGIVLNVVVGIIGAIFGGFIMSLLGMGGVSGFNLYSFGVAVLGAIVLLSLVQFIRSSK
ncbi:MAG: GlsB/YeaQ/YmgE family stress response membrane protein [Patescibacteria group bacterium]